MKHIIQNLFLVFWSTFFGFLILEGILWFVSPPVSSGLPSGLVISAPGGVMKLAPGFNGVMDNRREFSGKDVRVNSNGRRVVPSSAKVKTEVNSLHILGDSQTFGHGLKDVETWPNKFQENLVESNEAFRVVNWGVPGANVEHYWRRLPELFSEASPGDVLLIGLTWNDFTTSPGSVVQTAAKNRLSNHLKPPTNGKFSVFPNLQALKLTLNSLTEHSAFVAALMPSLRTIYYLNRTAHPLTDILASKVTEDIFKLLARMRKRTETEGLQFYVLFLTNGVFLVDKAYAAFSQHGRFFRTQNVMGDEAEALCKSHLIYCIDAFEALHINAGEGAIYPIDGHYTPLSAQRIADFLSNTLMPIISRNALRDSSAKK